MVSVFSFYSTISIAFELFLLIQKRGIHCLIPESNLQTKSWDKLMSEKSFWNFKEKQKIFQSKIWSTKFVVSIYLTAQRWCFFCFFFFQIWGERDQILASCLQPPPHNRLGSILIEIQSPCLWAVFTGLPQQSQTTIFGNTEISTLFTFFTQQCHGFRLSAIIQSFNNNF